MAQDDDAPPDLGALQSRLGIAPATQAAPAQTPVQDDPPPDITDLQRRLGIAASQSEAQQTQTTSAQPSLPERIVGGMALGLHGALDYPLEKVAGVFGYGDQVKANADAQRKQLEQAYGNSAVTKVAQGATQTGVTLAEMSLLNPLLRGAVGVGSAAIRGAAPYVSNALDWGSQLLSGETALPTVVGRIASRGVQGAAAGAEASALNGDDVGKGALTGGVAGATIPTLLSGAGSIIVPKIEQRLAQLGNVARQYGINLGVGQMGNRNVANTLEYLGAGSGNAATQGQINRAIGQQMGIADATELTPAIVNRGVNNIRQTFDRIENTNSTGLDLSNDDLQRLADVETQAQGTPSWGRVNTILGQVRNAIGNNGKISGSDFHDLVQTGSVLGKAGNPTNPELSDFADEIEDTLRGAFARSLTPQQLADYNAARGQYKAFKTVAPLIDAQGNVATGSLMSRVARRYGNGDVADVLDGQEPMVDIARIGQIQQGADRGGGLNATRIAAQIAAHVLPIGALGGGGYLHGGGLEGLAGMVTGEVVPHVAGAGVSALYNNPLISSLAINRALNNLYVPNLVPPVAVGAALDTQNR